MIPANYFMQPLIDLNKRPLSQAQFVPPAVSFPNAPNTSQQAMGLLGAMPGLSSMLGSLGSLLGGNAATGFEALPAAALEGFSLSNAAPLLGGDLASLAALVF